MVKGCFVSIRIFHFPVSQSLDIDIIGVLQNTYFLRSDITQNTYRKSWSGEWMACNQMFRHTQFTTYVAYFILE